MKKLLQAILGMIFLIISGISLTIWLGSRDWQMLLVTGICIGLGGILITAAIILEGECK